MHKHFAVTAPAWILSPIDKKNCLLTRRKIKCVNFQKCNIVFKNITFICWVQVVRKKGCTKYTV